VYQRASGGPDNDFVQDIAFAPDGTAYLATNDLLDVREFGGGLSVRTPAGTWSVVRRGDGGLSSDTAYSVLYSADGTLWVGELAGVDRARADPGADGTRPRDWTTVSGPDDRTAPLRDVFDLHLDRSGAMWFATVFGVHRLVDGRWTTWGADTPGLEAQLVRSIAEDPRGRIWVGTTGQGVAVYEDGSWSRFHTGNSDLGNDHVYDLAVDDQGRVWAGTAIGVHLLADGRWTGYTSRSSPLRDDDVRAVLVDRRGWVWLGTHDGLSILHDGQWRSCGPATSGSAGPAHPVVIALEQAPDGSIWIGTYGGGVTVFRAGEAP